MRLSCGHADCCLAVPTEDWHIKSTLILAQVLEPLFKLGLQIGL